MFCVCKCGDWHIGLQLRDVGTGGLHGIALCLDRLLTTRCECVLGKPVYF